MEQRLCSRPPPCRRVLRRCCVAVTARAKTRRKVIATLSKETETLLDRYLAGLGIVIPRDQPFIRNRSGHVYSKDTLGDDFRAVRNAVFPKDDRRLMDMRRTGNVEAMIGGAEPTHLSAKLGNTLSQSNQIYETYTPVQLAAVRQADKARVVGRRRLKLSKIAAGIKAEQNERLENKSRKFPTQAPAIESELKPTCEYTESRKVLAKTKG